VGLEKGEDKQRQEVGDSVLKRFTRLRFQIMRFVRLGKALISKQRHTGSYAGAMPDWEPWGTEAHLSLAAKGYVHLCMYLLYITANLLNHLALSGV